MHIWKIYQKSDYDDDDDGTTGMGRHQVYFFLTEQDPRNSTLVALGIV